MGRRWRILRVDAFRPNGHGFLLPLLPSRRDFGQVLHLQLPVGLRREIPAQCKFRQIPCRERLWVGLVVDLKRRYRNSLNEWMNGHGFDRIDGRGLPPRRHRPTETPTPSNATGKGSVRKMNCFYHDDRFWSKTDSTGHILYEYTSLTRGEKANHASRM